jgi:N-acetyl-1-D-myo-inositol-2-amino-2-deoxy-alpha-D-glucopyranoside deacetylase
MPTMSETTREAHQPTLMTVHAHPDDEIIGTGGAMARAVTEGRRVVLVTCTRGELGEIVVPELDTEDNHRRLGEMRAAELEAAMAELGVTEWENLGYRDSGMMGDPGNRDPRSFWQAPIDDAARRLVWLMRRVRPDVVTTYNDFGGYGHPDHIQSHRVAVAAFERAGDPAWYPEQLAPEVGGTGPALAEGGLEPWAPAKLYEQAWDPEARARMHELLHAQGLRSFWDPPEDATPDQRAEFEGWMARMAVDPATITTTVDVSAHTAQRFAALRCHATQISMDNPLVALGPDAWRELGGRETFVLREARIPTTIPETDLFAGID